MQDALLAGKECHVGMQTRAATTELCLLTPPVLRSRVQHVQMSHLARVGGPVRVPTPYSGGKGLFWGRGGPTTNITLRGCLLPGHRAAA